MTVRKPVLGHQPILPRSSAHYRKVDRLLADPRAAMASGDKGAIAKAAQGAWSRFSALFASFGDFGPALAK